MFVKLSLRDFLPESLLSILDLISDVGGSLEDILQARQLLYTISPDLFSDEFSPILSPILDKIESAIRSLDQGGFVYSLVFTPDINTGFEVQDVKEYLVGDHKYTIHKQTGRLNQIVASLLDKALNNPPHPSNKAYVGAVLLYGVDTPKKLASAGNLLKFLGGTSGGIEKITSPAPIGLRARYNGLAVCLEWENSYSSLYSAANIVKPEISPAIKSVKIYRSTGERGNLRVSSVWELEDEFQLIGEIPYIRGKQKFEDYNYPEDCDYVVYYVVYELKDKEDVWLGKPSNPAKVRFSSVCRTEKLGGWNYSASVYAFNPMSATIQSFAQNILGSIRNLTDKESFKNAVTSITEKKLDQISMQINRFRRILQNINILRSDLFLYGSVLSGETGGVYAFLNNLIKELYEANLEILEEPYIGGLVLYSEANSTSALQFVKGYFETVFNTSPTDFAEGVSSIEKGEFIETSRSEASESFLSFDEKLRPTIISRNKKIPYDP